MPNNAAYTQRSTLSASATRAIVQSEANEIVLRHGADLVQLAHDEIRKRQLRRVCGRPHRQLLHHAPMLCRHELDQCPRFIDHTPGNPACPSARGFPFERLHLSVAARVCRIPPLLRHLDRAEQAARDSGSALQPFNGLAALPLLLGCFRGRRSPVSLLQPLTTDCSSTANLGGCG